MHEIQYMTSSDFIQYGDKGVMLSDAKSVREMSIKHCVYTDRRS